MSKKAIKRKSKKKSHILTVSDDKVGNVIDKIDTLLLNIRTKKLKKIDNELVVVKRLTYEQARIVGKSYKRTRKEIKMAILGRDEYVNESYSHFSTTSLRLAILLFDKVYAILKEKNKNESKV